MIVLLRFGMLMMLVLVIGYLIGGTKVVNLDQALAIFPILLKPGWL